MSKWIKARDSGIRKRITIDAWIDKDDENYCSIDCPQFELGHYGHPGPPTEEELKTPKMPLCLLKGIVDPNQIEDDLVEETDENKRKFRRTKLCKQMMEFAD